MRASWFIPAVALLARAAADPVVIAEPSADRWMYLSNATPGSRGQASTFSALPVADGVDDRFGFFLIRFDTAALVPAGLPPASYHIRSVVLTATIGQDGLFVYDPSADPVTSYGTPTVPASVPDADPGRPLELHGAGFRNAWTAGLFEEDSPNGGAAPGTRNAFPLGFDSSATARDVSNNVSEGFDSAAWALGASDDLPAGDPVPLETSFRFTLDTSLPGVARYLAEGFSSGAIWLSLSSLHPATQQDGEFVSWLTRDDAIHRIFGGLAPTLTFEVDLGLPLVLNREDGASALSWPEFAGFTHTLLACADLPAGDWEPLHSHAALSAGTGTFRDPTAGRRRFYRLEILPTPP